MVEEFYTFCNVLDKQGLSPDEGLLLLCIVKDLPRPDWLNGSRYITNPTRLGFVTDTLEPTEKAYQLFNMSKQEVEECFIDIQHLASCMRNLYPKIMLYNQSARGNVTAIIKKLEEFSKLFKNEKFTNQEVYEATEKYVKRCEDDNFKYMKLLKYFILKDGSSVLADMITAIREGSYEDLPQFMGDDIT